MATRRELLKAGATTGLMALLPSVSLVASAAAAARPRIKASTAALTRSTFGDTLFDDFRVMKPVQAFVDLRLVEIRDLPSGAGAGAEDAFLLRFNAPPLTALGQGTYGLVHPRLGEIDLFLVPMAGGELPAYEAIINRQAAADPRQSPPSRQLGLRLRPQL